MNPVSCPCWRGRINTKLARELMNCILLLGAGCSRNWNGRLASEVRSELQTRLHGDQQLQLVLQRSDFETVVTMIQAEFERTPNPENAARLHRVQEAVKAVF